MGLVLSVMIKGNVNLKDLYSYKMSIHKRDQSSIHAGPPDSLDPEMVTPQWPYMRYGTRMDFLNNRRVWLGFIFLGDPGVVVDDK